MKIQEFTGKTTQEAIDNGLAELGVTIADVHVDVLQEGAKGLFGLFGSKPARVRLTIMEEEREDDHGLSDLIGSLSLNDQAKKKPQPKPAVKAEPVKPAAKPEAPKAAPKAEAVKLAKMNAEQKAAYESEQKDRRIAEMEAQLQKIALGKVAGEILKEQGMDATQDILDMVVGTTAEDTKAQVEAFVKLVNAQVEIRERQRATGTTPKSYTGAEPMSEIEQRIAKYRK